MTRERAAEILGPEHLAALRALVAQAPPLSEPVMQLLRRLLAPSDGDTRAA